jgi:hypothetical protein
MKVAETDALTSSVTTHPSTPPHSPPQLPNSQPPSAVIVSVTAVPAGKAEEHNSLWPAVQSIPNGLDVIRPCPMTETDNSGSGWMADSQERRAKPTTPTPVARRREGDMIHDVLLTTTDATGGPPSVVMPE